MSKKTIEEKYQEKTLHEHILTRPDSYLGSTKPDNIKLWTFNEETQDLEEKNVYISQGLYKIYDEIIVNACDQLVKDKNKCDTIKVTIDKKSGEISVWNNGSGIPIAKHKKAGLYVPEFLFGKLLTSDNYDDEEERITGGKNGYGAKITNIYSTEFIIETVDDGETEDKDDEEREPQFFSVRYYENMFKKDKPVIRKRKKNEETHVKITFTPDYEKFGLEGLTDDIISLFKKRLYDILACNKGVKVFYNDKQLKLKGFEEYIKLFCGKKVSVTYEEINSRWSVGIVVDPNEGFRQISYVNGICTYSGGTHVEYILKKITKKIKDKIKEKHKDLVVKGANVKENLTLFINCRIVNPDFTSQTKEEMKTKVSNFGSQCDISEDMIAKVIKENKLIDIIVKMAKAKESLGLNKSDGKGNSRSLRDIPGLQDANNAGSKNNKACLLICEGKSAFSYAKSGIDSMPDGRDNYGLLALKGKPLNVRESKISKLSTNEEFEYIKRVLGLKQNKEYEDTTELRYGGGIMIITDQDPDGDHIKGLIMNMFDTFWQCLLKIPGFIKSISTPLYKVFKKTDKKKEKGISFYKMSDYKKWAEENDVKNYKVKYYKGLGTSDAKEAKELFSTLEDNIISYQWTEENDKGKSKSAEAILKGFEKKKIPERKKWLTNGVREYLELQYGDVTYEDFIDKGLKHFSYYDCDRSIPNLIDGLKPSQRKTLWGCMLCGVDTEEVKVSQLAGSIIEKTQYHHGEASLHGTIINMAQNYPGSNNINLLYPAGQFGTRLFGGKDHASPRYIYTKLSKLTRLIFRRDDECVLEYNEDDGKQIEPTVFAPIIPMILVNGAMGIGTGFSTNIPNFNPLDICNNILRMLDEEEPKPIVPWYRGFTGEIINISKNNEHNKFLSKGIYEILDNSTIRITELPVSNGTGKDGQIWTDDYKSFLNKHWSYGKKEEDPDEFFISDLRDDSKNNGINFKIKLGKGKLQEFKTSDEKSIEKMFKLEKNINLTNMTVFDKDNKITKMDYIEDIFQEFYSFRIGVYIKRKEYIEGDMLNKLNILKYKLKFIKDFNNDVIIINKKTSKNDVIKQLEENDYPKLCGDHLSKNFSYDYLTQIKLFDLTTEKMEELENEHKKLEKKYNAYVKLTVEDIWRSELEEFMEAYKIWFEEMEAEDKLLNSGEEKKVKRVKKEKHQEEKKKIDELINI